MPELPEVETVKEALKRKILNRKIVDVNVLYNNIVEYPKVTSFKEEIINETINDIKRRGKWLVFVLDNYYLLSHLRMEGKYNIRGKDEEITKHEHVIFYLDDNTSLRYNDTRKFGRMYLIKKEDFLTCKPIKDLGLEPFSNELTKEYLKEKYKKLNKPIKTIILDQSIIVGIGNIYADEILFLSRINPLTLASELDDNDLDNIIKYTKEVLSSAIKSGGTTIRSYTSEEGVHGRFQQNLLVHTKDICPVCNNKIEKIKVGSRGTYYCSNCQKKRK